MFSWTSKNSEESSLLYLNWSKMLIFIMDSLGWWANCHLLCLRIMGSMLRKWPYVSPSSSHTVYLRVLCFVNDKSNHYALASSFLVLLRPHKSLIENFPVEQFVLELEHHGIYIHWKWAVQINVRCVVFSVCCTQYSRTFSHEVVWGYFLQYLRFRWIDSTCITGKCMNERCWSTCSPW